MKREKEFTVYLIFFFIIYFVGYLLIGLRFFCEMPKVKHIVGCLILFPSIYHILPDGILGILTWIILIASVFYQGLCWAKRGLKKIAKLTYIIILLELFKNGLGYVNSLLSDKFRFTKGYLIVPLFYTIFAAPQIIIFVRLIKNIFPFYITGFEEMNNGKRKIIWNNFFIFWFIISLLISIIIANCHNLLSVWCFAISNLIFVSKLSFR